MAIKRLMLSLHHPLKVESCIGRPWTTGHIETGTYGFARQNTRGDSMHLIVMSCMNFLIDLRSSRTSALVQSGRNNTLDMERLLPIGPLTRFSHGGVERLDKRQHARL